MKFLQTIGIKNNVRNVVGYIVVFAILFVHTGIAHAASLTNFSISSSNYAAGATATYTFNYTIATANPNMVLYAYFPTGFNLGAIGSPMDTSKVSVTINGTPATINGGSSWGVGGSFVVRLNDSTLATTGANIVVTAQGIVNPSTPGNYSNWAFIQTADGGGNGIDTLASLPTVTITAGDTTPPTVPGTPSVNSNNATNSFTPTWSWAGSTDSGSGMAVYQLKWSQNSDCSGGSNTSTGSTSYSIPAGGSQFSTGTWYFCVAAQDIAGNLSAFSTGSVLVDTVAPVLTTIQSIPSYVTADKAVYHFSTSKACSALAQAPSSTFGSVATHIGSLSTPGGDVSAYLSGIQSSGTYSVSFSCMDTAGNISNTLTMGPFTVFTPHTGGAVSMIPTAIGKKDFTIVINKGKNITTSPNISIDFNADPETVNGYSISLDKTFAQGVITPFTSETKSATFTLPDTAGTYPIYVEFFSKTGNKSEVLTGNVTYQKGTTIKKASTKKIVHKKVVIKKKNIRQLAE